MSRLLNYFFRGLVILAPAVVTVYVFWLIFSTVDQWMGFRIPGLGIVVTIALITLFGFLTSSVLARWVLGAMDGLFKRLPLVRLVYTSTRDLLDQDLPVKFGEIFMRHQVSPGAFCLEITESAIMDDPVRAQQTLERLHAMGCDLSIDDFGTGYSSLAYLKRLPVDELKIDKSFVLNMASDVGDAKIVRSTIDLGHNMGLRVVAEGVESEAAWNILAGMGCDQGQGYFMSRPMPAGQLAGWVEQWRASALAE